MNRTGEPPWTVLREGRVRRITSATALSVVGDGCNGVAVTFAVIALTPSASALSLVLGARLVGLALSILGGGVLADRADRRRLLLSADLVRCVSQAAAAAALVGGHGTVALLAATQLIHGLASGVFLPANGGYLPSLVKPERLQAANGIIVSTNAIGGILGPVVGGFLTAAAGAGWALGVDAATFLVSAALISTLPASPPDPDAEPEHPLKSFATGFTEVWSRPWLRVGVGFFLVGQIVLNGPLYVIGPVVADRHYGGAAAWGLVMGLFGAGAFVGALLASRRTDAYQLWLIVVVAGVPAFLLWALAVQATLEVVGACAVVAGAASSFVDVTWWTLLQRRIAAAALSRVLSWDLFSLYVGRPTSTAITGPLLAVVGAGVMLGTAGAGLVVLAAAVAVLPAIHHVRGGYDEPDPPAPNPEDHCRA